MSRVKDPAPVKLIIGMISNKKAVFCDVEAILEKKFGVADYKSDFIKFDFTDYYEKEMGRKLLRRFLSFKRMIDPGRLAAVKIFTNKLEGEFAVYGGSRRINIDPGYLTESAFILASTKGFQHRIYLSKGVYAEVTLKYQRPGFLPYDWTYRDFQTKPYTDFLKTARDSYRDQLKEILWKQRKNTGV